MNCIACDRPITSGAWVQMTYQGFTGARVLNGLTVRAHAGCVRLAIPDREIPLPPRIPDAEADDWTELVG